MAGWTGKKTNVVYTKPQEPSFLKKFKERVGYKEDGGLSDKFATMPRSADEDLEDKDDELPQVVRLREGDLTQEEYEKLKREGKLDDLINDGTSEIKSSDLNEEPSADGRILFRKPVKRSSADEQSEKTKKSKRDECVGKKDRKDKKEKKKASLLSFDEDEEEEDG